MKIHFTVYVNNHNKPMKRRINIIMKLNRYEKKIIKGIVESRKGIYETPKRDRLSYKPCKEYDAALSLFMKKLIYAEATNELEFEGPATPDPSLDGSLVNCINLMQQKES